jgi:hypothetical protein
VLAASIAFRLPPLINAEGTNSDAAVVGLQAMHLLRGEWSPFLWGSGYQTSVDATIAAALFAFTGPSPVALMASSLAGHILLTWFVFDALRRHLPAWTAAVAVLPLVFAPDPVHTYVLYPPRQASLTLVFAAFWLLQGVVGSRRPRARLAAGGAVAMLALYADPYALLFLPGEALLGALVLAEGRGDRPELRRRLAALVGGAIAGLVPYELLTHHPLASRGQTSLKLDIIPHNLGLLLDPCGQWLLSTKVYAAKTMTDYQPWEVPAGYHAFQVLAAASLVAGILSGFALVFVKTIPWALRRLGLVGAAMFPVTLGGFLVSPMVMDHFSSRYLAAALLCAPFALAPAAYLLRGRRFAFVLAPYLISGAVAGWVAYRPFGLARHPSLAVDDRLGVALRERGVRYAVADYWASYRLTLAFAEHPVVVPTNEGEDRFKPYRDAFASEPVVAYIHDAYRSRERLDEAEAKIKAGETGFDPRYDRFVLGNFTVLMLTRRAPASRLASAP